jgi:hypothetical protein
MNFSYDRNIDLAILGVDGTNYLSCFKKLAWLELRVYASQKVFYASVLWNQPRVTETFIEIDLDAGTREGKKLINGHTLFVDCSEWEQTQANRRSP